MPNIFLWAIEALCIVGYVLMAYALVTGMERTRYPIIRSTLLIVVVLILSAVLWATAYNHYVI